MKKIEIYQENLNPIIIFDEDNSNISKYTKKLSEMLKPDKVSIIETSKCELIIRPNKIVSIKVSEYKELNGKNNVNVKTKGNITKKEDIILDKEL